MRCARCQESCSDRGHLKGVEITSQQDKDARKRVFKCLRCDVDLVENVCECCDVTVGALEARPQPPPPKPEPPPKPVVVPEPTPAPKPKKKVR